MISFSTLDYIIIVAFLCSIIGIGFIASNGKNKSDDDFLLSGRKVGLSLFVLTNVATWYGGILGVGEFSFRYGIVSWFTQGFPYYIFALIFAFLFAGKIRSASLFTIPDKLEETYGNKVSILSAILIFILVSPAPYLLIMGQIIALIFNIDYFVALLVSSLLSSIYLIKGGYKSNIWTDAFSFLIMFTGFLIVVIVAFNNFGGYNFLSVKLPEEHLSLTGDTSVTFVFVWFLIALWTFTDPGFHQRCYSAKDNKVAKYGIVISVFFWLLFDFLTNTTGLYTRAILPNLENPVLAFPFLANEILTSGLKGLFFAAMIATVLSTLNSFIFLSATTFSRDFIYRFRHKTNSNSQSNISIISYTKIGIILTLVISITTAYYFKSVVELWYTIGSICIPGIILLVISSYYPRISVSKRVALLEIIIGVSTSIVWIFVRDYFSDNIILSQIEPMIVGLTTVIIVHFTGLIIKRKR